jgi:hypothetical protein
MKLFSPITRKRVKPLLATSVLVIAAAGMAAAAGHGVAQRPSAKTMPAGLPVLVRAWNPATGELVGWMPMNRVAITLELLPGQKGTPSFDLNNAVNAHFPYRPFDAVKYGRLRVVSKTLTLEGRKWIPADEAPNIVRIHKLAFLVKDIDFGDSKWQRPTAVNPASQTGFGPGAVGGGPPLPKLAAHGRK